MQVPIAVLHQPVCGSSGARGWAGAGGGAEWRGRLLGSVRAGTMVARTGLCLSEGRLPGGGCPCERVVRAGLRETWVSACAGPALPGYFFSFSMCACVSVSVCLALGSVVAAAVSLCVSV